MIPKFSDGFFSIDNGFLPINKPLAILPDKYKDIQSILDNMPIVNKDGLLGYLANKDNTLKDTVERLDNYLEIIKTETSLELIASLYRGYCFITSAYLLQPAHWEFLETGEYGVGRDRLPENIASPLIY